jgi:hypothetical protein
LIEAEILILPDPNYTNGQYTLIEIWQKFIKTCAEGINLPELGLVFKFPWRKYKGPRQRLLGLPVRSLGCKGDMEILNMKPMDFVYLMAKSGIRVEVNKLDKPLT